MRRIGLTLLACLTVATDVTFGADPIYRKIRVSEVDLSAGTPQDLVGPEGKSRWRFESLALSTVVTRTLRAESIGAAEVDIVDTREAAVGSEASRVILSDPSGNDAAVRWVFPDRFPDSMRPGSHAVLRLGQRRGSSTEQLWIEVETVGVGWLHLPSGPRETVLQRARVFRAPAEGASYSPGELMHRWVDPRAGVVAMVVGPLSGPRERIAVGAAWVLEEALAGVSVGRIFVDEIDFSPRTQLNYGWVKQEVCVGGTSEGIACDQDSDCSGTGATCGTFVSSMTPGAYTNIGQLLAAVSWDFSPSVAACTPSSADCKDSVQGNVQLGSAESCNADPDVPSPGTGVTCGYQGAGRVLGRQDYDPGTADWIINNQVTERAQRASDVTLWLRAGAQKEGVSGAFGTGETRFCYDPDAGKPEVALYRFAHQDPSSGDWYFEVGDTWQTTFNCDQVLFSTGISQNAICGAPGTLGRQRAAGNSFHGGCSHPGTQSGTVLKEGVVTLPSGHTFNALVIRTLADFCVYNDCTCGGLFCGIVADVRTDTLIWQVPHLGSVVLLMSKQNVSDLTTYDKLALADVRVGHFPPVSITTGTVTDTSIALSWDPGNHTHRIDAANGYNVYWDTVSGATTAGAYANNTTVSTTDTTVGGLAPGTTYYLTVTSNSTYANPSNPGVSTTYESLKYPTTISGDPNFVYPIEVQATTACGAAYSPSSEVSNLTVDRSGGGVEVCWDPAHVAEPCVDGYRVLGAATPERGGNFNALADVGQTGCWTGSPTEGYFLVVTRGSGGTGPWGHYGF